MTNQRQFKFRVWDNHIKKYITNVPTGGFDSAWIRITLEGNLFWQVEYGQGDLDKSRFILQQYTSLRDKNDKDIYEGDIVKYKWQSGEGQTETDVGEVFFEQGIFYFDRHNRLAANDSNFVLESLEVMGNIFEDAALLEY